MLSVDDYSWFSTEGLVFEWQRCTKDLPFNNKFMTKAENKFVFIKEQFSIFPLQCTISLNHKESGGISTKRVSVYANSRTPMISSNSDGSALTTVIHQ